jgi:predicted DNA binding CopG/RHH family protein
LAQVIGAKEGSVISNTKYKKALAELVEAIEHAEVIPDFLPSPDQLVLKDETVRVTLDLNKRSVDFFKSSARENGVPYQSMIRKVLDIYAERYLHERL